jgi:hypothetical protein
MTASSPIELEGHQDIFLISKEQAKEVYPLKLYGGLVVN